ncbi:MAG: SnoaL-like domain-containing protein [Rhizobiales bacterium]|nr:SnoaL-like domain-containing protein [Hyphomicrobiales bacterium]
MSIIDTAKTFFDACESGKGWAECAQYCAPDATFACQSQVLADTHSLEAYTEWMKGLLVPLPDGHYELKGFAVDDAREIALGFAVFHGTHTADGGPIAPTGQSVAADYVYAMEFAGGKVTHMTKIWNDAESLRALGWA